MICNNCDKFDLRPDIISQKAIGKGRKQRIETKVLSYANCLGNPIGKIIKKGDDYMPEHERSCWKVFSKKEETVDLF